MAEEKADMEELIYKDDFVKRLRGNFVELVDNMHDARDLLHHLFQDGAIDEEEMEIIDSKPTKKGANRKLLGILYKKDNRAFGSFLNALRSIDDDYIVDNLLSYNVSKCKADNKEIEKTIDEDKRLELLTEQVEKQTKLLFDIKSRIDNVQTAPQSAGGDGETEDSAAQVIELQGMFDGLNANFKDYIDAQITQKVEAQIAKDDNAWKRRSREMEVQTDQRFEAEGGEDVPPLLSPGSMTTKSSFLYKRMRSYQRKGKPIDRETERISVQLAKDIIRYISYGADVTYHPDQYEKAMRRVVTELLKQQASFFNDVMQTIKIDELNGLETVCNVADEMLRVGEPHWGRVAALYAFVGFIAKQLTVFSSKEEGDTFVENLGDFLGFYVNSKLGRWIQDNGGWDAFVKYFPEMTTESQSAWKTVLFSALGLGTVAAFILANK